MQALSYRSEMEMFKQGVYIALGYFASCEADVSHGVEHRDSSHTTGCQHKKAEGHDGSSAVCD